MAWMFILLKMTRNLLTLIIINLQGFDASLSLSSLSMFIYTLVFDCVCHIRAKDRTDIFTECFCVYHVSLIIYWLFIIYVCLIRLK